ncbi:unnamed protein product [Adineta steineri]|uniref:Uncharacterized protein n=1 Tax=Adineta steineri TaxID=433720 RepID=A0A816BGU2_9BILA|nr:unnamed protein product [Adineta steineri]CAF1609099.1 unnamed protein product [Adineta steineri]
MGAVGLGMDVKLSCITPTRISTLVEILANDFFLIGWFGFCSSVTGIVEALCLGALTDTPRFRRSLEMLILISFIDCFLSVLWFQRFIRSVFYDVHIPGSAQITIGLLFSLA